MRPSSLRPTFALLGLALIGSHVSLQGTIGFVAQLGLGFLRIGWREATFWLSHLLILTPGLLLLGWSLAPTLGPLMERSAKRAAEIPARRGPWLVVGYGALLFMLAVLGRSSLLLGLPITNDEYQATYGARVVLSGQLSAPAPDPQLDLPMPFLIEREGQLSAVDYPGVIFFEAAALASGLGSHLYALLAALAGMALVTAAGRLDGRRGAFVAAACWLVSPMALTLSFTGHGQLVSRSFVALALLCLVMSSTWEDQLGQKEGQRISGSLSPWALALGIFAGLAFLTRPGETICLLTPAALWLVFNAWRHGAWRPFLNAALGWLPAALAWAAYNAATTGTWWLEARRAEGASSPIGTSAGIWERLGGNLGFNVLMLAIYFLGPAALALVGLAFDTRKTSSERRAPIARLLGTGVALHLLLALAHDDTGLHLVGPIHYSEAAAPLLLLLVLGVRNGCTWLAAQGFRWATPAVLGLFYLAGSALFLSTHAVTLRAQAEINAMPLRAVDGLENAVVIADPPPRLWALRPELDAVRSWTGDLPHPDPFLRDPVIFAYSQADPQALARTFPNRQIYRMTYHAEGEAIRLRRLR